MADEPDESLRLNRRRLLGAVSVGAGAFLSEATSKPAASEPIEAATAHDLAPKVRTVTAFITINPQDYQTQIRSAVEFLSNVRRSLTSAGYEVMTIRIVTQPFPQYTKGLSRTEAMRLFKGLNDLAMALKFSPNIGPVMSGSGDQPPIDLLIDVLSAPDNICNANIIVTNKDGIAWDAVRHAGMIVKRLGVESPRGLGNFNFAAIAMMKPYGPFYPGAWHPGGGVNAFAVGMQGAGLVIDAFSKDRNPATAGLVLQQMMAEHTQRIEAAASTHAAPGAWTYAGVDPTPAPLGKVSIGAAVETFLEAPFGSPGTETACGIITRAVRSAPVKQTGYSGLMIPILEDEVLSRRWSEGAFGVDSILAYSAVCAGGLDTVPLPGSISAEALSRMIGDVATLAFKWDKPLAARLLPAAGKNVGERTSFAGGALGDAIVQPIGGALRQF